MFLARVGGKIRGLNIQKKKKIGGHLYVLNESLSLECSWLRGSLSKAGGEAAVEKSKGSDCYVAEIKAKRCV